MAAGIRLGRAAGNKISSVTKMLAMGDSEIRTQNNVTRNLNLGYSSRHPLEYFPRNIRRPKMMVEPEYPEITRRILGASPLASSSTYCVRVVINSHFALEEFNNQKNEQLQFVKLVKAYHQWTGGWQTHLLTLDAIDADNVIKTYQAIVVEHYPSKPPDPQLKLFGLVADDGNGTLLKLIDNRRTCDGGGGGDRYSTRGYKTSKEDQVFHGGCDSKQLARGLAHVFLKRLHSSI